MEPDYLSFDEACEIAAELRNLLALEASPSWARDAIEKTLPSRPAWNRSSAKHFGAAERCVRAVAQRKLCYDMMLGLVTEATNAEQSPHYETSPEWAPEIIEEYLDWLDDHEDSDWRQVVGEEDIVWTPAKIAHLEAAMRCVFGWNKRQDKTPAKKAVTA